MTDDERERQALEIKRDVWHRAIQNFIEALIIALGVMGVIKGVKHVQGQGENSTPLPPSPKV